MRASREITKTLSHLYGGYWDKCGCMGKGKGWGRGGRWTETGKPISLTRKSKIIDEDLNIIGGAAVSFQDAPPPTSTPKYYHPHRSGRGKL